MFMAVAQALGSDMGIVIELESIVMLQIPSAERHKKRETERRVSFIPVTYIIMIQGHGRRGIALRSRLKVDDCFVELSWHVQAPPLYKSCFNSVSCLRGEEQGAHSDPAVSLTPQ